MTNTLRITMFCLFVAIGSATAFGQGLQGTAHGGQQPVAGAHVYLLAPAQSTTVGAASVSLLSPGTGAGSDQIGTYVTSDANGDFSFPNYSCPSANLPVYLYSAGGNAGYGSNSAISLMAYVGPCGTINANTYVLLNEATTVAMAYAVAGYSTDPLHISYSGTPLSLVGITNAFANAANLANSSNGTAYSTIPSGYATVPQATVYTLADALASCINQTSGAGNCSTLFAATTVSGVAPTDTATAVMNIAHNPASSTAPGIQNGTDIASIMTLSQAYEQFLPVLQTAPNDLTLGLTFSNPSFEEPAALAIDGAGDAWIVSQVPPNAGYVIEIASSSAMGTNNVTYPVTYTPQSEPFSIAVDAASQNIWIGTGVAVEEISTEGVPASGSPFAANSGGAYGINLDSAGNVWVAGGTELFEISATGSGPCVTGCSLPAGSNAEPEAIALDASQNVWVTDYANDSLVEFSNQGSTIRNLGPDGSPSTMNYATPSGVAVDAAQNIWVANNANNNDVEFVPNTSSLNVIAPDEPPAYTSPVLTFLTIDGAGNVWSSLESSECITTSVCLGVAEVSAAGQPLSGPGYAVEGYQQSGAITADATAIDGSGDVWIANSSAGNVTELVGAAAPVVTPLSSAVSSNSLGKRP